MRGRARMRGRRGMDRETGQGTGPGQARTRARDECGDGKRRATATGADEELVPGRTVTRLGNAKALRAYAHPVRMKLILALRTRGPLTATQAGRLLGESSGTCSFHLRQLAKYGLVEETGEGTGREKPWRATTTSTAWDDVQQDPEAAAAAGLLTRGARRVVLRAAHAVPGGAAAGDRGMAAGRDLRRPLPVGDRRRADRDTARHQRGHRPVLRADWSSRSCGRRAPGWSP